VKDNPALPGGSLKSKPTWVNISNVLPRRLFFGLLAIHLPESATVVLSEDTLVATLHGALSLAEKALATSAAGAAQVQEFHRQSRFLRSAAAGDQGNHWRRRKRKGSSQPEGKWRTALKC
jgi:Na+-translocating membrane potential-generating system (MpsC)